MTETQVVHRPLLPVGDELMVLDAGRRLYAGLNRAGDGWHVIAPDGTGVLHCSCPGGTFRASCYRLAQCEAWERGDAARFGSAAEPTWFDAPAVLA